MPDKPELAHPWIGAVDRPAPGALTVTIAPTAVAVQRIPNGPPLLGDLVREHLEDWTEVYDHTYGAAEGLHPVEFDLSGWRTSGTGEPMPPEHMAEWVDRTVELVLRARPRTVLELGCGTGMLLHRLHPHLTGYVGTDVAEHVVSRLSGLNLPNVTVVRAAAHEINGPAVRQALAGLGGPPDCVLLNSVTQCFPGVGYLAAVIQDAISVVAEGGTVIVGDIRHAGLLTTYHRELLAAEAGAAAGLAAASGEPGAGQAADKAAAEVVGQAAGTATDEVARRAAGDTELLLDPATLAEVAAGAGRRGTMALYAKTLTEDTELSRYRFDAVLRVDAEPAAAPSTLDWGDLGPDQAAALAGLSGPVLVRGIPNGLLRPGGPTAAALRSWLGDADAAVLIDPDDPTLLNVAKPAACAALPLTALTGSPASAGPAAPAGPGRPHEPLGAFARARVAGVVRRLLRQGGHPPVGELTVRMPYGVGLDALALDREVAAVDAAGRRALAGIPPGGGEHPTGNGGVPDTRLTALPKAIADLNAIALDVLTRLLTLTGALRGDEPRTAEQVLETLRVAPRHAWIVRRWLAVLTENGRVTRDGVGRYRPYAADPGGGGRRFAPGREELRRLREACAALGYPPEMAVYFTEALTRLPELLRDEIMAQSLLFPDGDMITSLSKDQNNVSNTYLNAAAGEVLGRVAATRSRPLRVLELGGGAGGSTDAALAGLGDTPVDYLFTDVSRFFTVAAKERFGERLRYGIADIDRDLTEQGLPGGGFDVVLAASVLHCARNAGDSLRAIRDVLAPGGVVVLTESVREHPLVLAAMQFLLSGRDDRPALGTGDRRGGTGRVFLIGDELPAELAEAGFRTLIRLPRPDSPLAAPAQHLFVATPL